MPNGSLSSSGTDGTDEAPGARETVRESSARACKTNTKQAELVRKCGAIWLGWLRSVGRGLDRRCDLDRRCGLDRRCALDRRCVTWTGILPRTGILPWTGGVTWTGIVPWTGVV